ncbi:hypothetical protein VTI74DRAFT_8346 [Chaetomium olivicolor]
MAPSGITPFNAANPLCTTNLCLQQVIGSIDNNPVAQFDACFSLFGAPRTVTITSPGETVLSTTTLTVPYTDIIVPVSTSVSTNYVTSTSYTEVVQTVTEYSSTSVATVTQVVSRLANRAVWRRGKCGTKPSATSTVLSTSSAAPFPIASNCPSLEEYSSACVCILAASSTATVTEPVPSSIVTVTETSTVPLTSTAVVNVVVPTTVVMPATSTITTTTTEIFQTTTTITSTVIPSPTYVSQVVRNPGFDVPGEAWTPANGNALYVGAGAGNAHSGNWAFGLLYDYYATGSTTSVSQFTTDLVAGHYEGIDDLDRVFWHIYR